MASLYTHVASNKRRSLALMFMVIVFVLGVVALYSYSARGDFSLVVVAAIFILPSTLLGYYQGDRMALLVNRAHPLPREAAPQVHRVVENLAIAAGLPTPKLYFIDSGALNAFATGRDPEHASIAVTRGLLEHLEPAELEGVIAHELSHVGNYDIRYGTVVAIFVGFLTILSDMVLRSLWWGGDRRDERREGNAGNLLAIVGLVLLILSPLIAKLIQLAISRQREFLADASGAMLTRYPEGLARALEKISQAPTLSHAAHSTAHLFIASPLSNRFTRLFSTHPPVTDRIRRLRELA
jgi:heat shock protein HtpX